MNLLELTPSQMADLEFDCACGQHHSVGIHKILIGSGVVRETGRVLQELGFKRTYVLMDDHTQKAAGEAVLPLLCHEQLDYHCHVFGPHLVPDENCLGAALMHLEPEDDCIVAIGSGTLNDVCRLLSARTKIPYIIVCTAPSMDGYASTVSPMIIGGHKITLPGVYPLAIVADTDIMKDAPMEMLRSGFGDVLGKFTALADWRLSEKINGEYLCEDCFQLMKKVLNRCCENAPLLQKRDPKAVEAVTEGLILAGVAMGLVGNSRPASGAEHHMAHFWEVDLLSRQLPHPLHGNCVGLTAVLAASLYELSPELKELVGDQYPDRQKIEALLAACGAGTHPRDLGIDRDLLHRSLLHAMEIRERYTILRYLDKNQTLGRYADLVTSRYYS